jgi:hypothetical protein
MRQLIPLADTTADIAADTTADVTAHIAADTTS